MQFTAELIHIPLFLSYPHPLSCDSHWTRSYLEESEIPGIQQSVFLKQDTLLYPLSVLGQRDGTVCGCGKLPAWKEAQDLGLQ